MEAGGITIGAGGLAVNYGGIQVLSSRAADILTLYINTTNAFVGNVFGVQGSQVRACVCVCALCRNVACVCSLGAERRGHV